MNNNQYNDSSNVNTNSVNNLQQTNYITSSLNGMNSSNQNATNLNNNNNNLEKKGRKTVTKLILSIINMVIVVPFVFKFGIIWMAIGGLCGSNFIYFSLLGIPIIYIIASFIFLIKQILNLIKS